MEGIVIRPFQPGDLAPVVAQWNQCLDRDPITEERFWRLLLLDPNFDPAGALVAERDGEVIGFLQAMAPRYLLGSAAPDAEKGYLTVFFVAEAHRTRGVGSALLEAGCAHLRSQGRTELWCNGYGPTYLFPGVDRAYRAATTWLEGHDFEVVAEPVAMGLRLEGAGTPPEVRSLTEELRRDGFELRMFRRPDTLPLIAFSETHFPQFGQTVRDGLQHGNEEIVVATRGGEIVGFAQWQNTYTDPPHGAPGRFGPFGVRPDLRNHGLGAAIFYYLVERVRANGARYLWFGWAGGRNLSFYQRAGCVVTRQFFQYCRAL